MAIQFLPQSAAQTPRNMLIDFAPLNAGIDSIADANRYNQKFDYLKQQDAKQEARASQSHAAGMQDREMKKVAGLAQMVLQEPDEGRAQALATRLYSTHPEFGSLLTKYGQDPKDYRNAAKFIIAETQGYKEPMDPLERDLKQAQVGKYKAETTALGQKNVLEQSIADMITGSGPRVPQAQPSAAPMVQPQSYQGGAQVPRFQQINNPLAPPVQQSNPLLQLTADESIDDGAVEDFTGPDATQPPPNPSDLVDTPLGRMTVEEARRKALGLALAGKGDAGKMLYDPQAASNRLGRAGANQNDKEEIAASNSIATLNTIKQSYDAKFLDVPKRFNLWGQNLAAKFGQLPEKDKSDLKAYATFRQSGWHNLNRVLKDLSGTAVTENEMERQLLDLPNPGKGIFDGDSPPDFEAKLKGALTFAHSAVARARYLRGKGFSGKPWEAGIAVEDMPRIINQRGQQIESELKQSNPQADPMQLQGAIKSKLKQEFGI